MTLDTGDGRSTRIDASRGLQAFGCLHTPPFLAGARSSFRMQGSPGTSRQLWRPVSVASRQGTCRDACSTPCPQISRFSPKRPETHRLDTVWTMIPSAPNGSALLKRHPALNRKVALRSISPIKPQRSLYADRGSRGNHWSERIDHQ